VCVFVVVSRLIDYAFLLSTSTLPQPLSGFV